MVVVAEIVFYACCPADRKILNSSAFLAFRSLNLQRLWSYVVAMYVAVRMVYVRMYSNGDPFGSVSLLPGFGSQGAGVWRESG